MECALDLRSEPAYSFFFSQTSYYTSFKRQVNNKHKYYFNPFKTYFVKYSAKLVEYLTKSVSKGSFWHLGPISSNTSNISNFPSPVSSKQVQEKAKLMTDEFWDMMGERPKGNIAEQSMNKPSKAFKHYPTKSEVDSWIEDLRQQAGSINCEVERKSDPVYPGIVGVRHVKGATFILFTPTAMAPFYALWQPAFSAPAPLLVHVPGYGAEMSAHPDLVMQGYSVLHINPLGYATPQGFDTTKMRDGTWPVLSDTVAGKGDRGYKSWLINCVQAIQWGLAQAEALPDRISFFGTSQGGGAALLLGSIFSGRGARCVAADLPFLTDLPLQCKDEPKKEASDTALVKSEEDWRGLGFVDTLSHAHRLKLPVLLTAGSLDGVCTPEAIHTLFKKLPSTKAYCLLDGQGHDYTMQFIQLALAWFRLYA